MKLEQWSHIRNAVKEQRNEVGRDLEMMKAYASSYDELIETFPKYKEAEKLWVKYDKIVDHMDVSLSVSEIEAIDYES